MERETAAFDIHLTNCPAATERTDAETSQPGTNERATGEGDAEMGIDRALLQNFPTSHYALKILYSVISSFETQVQIGHKQDI